MNKRACAFWSGVGCLWCIGLLAAGLSSVRAEVVTSMGVELVGSDVTGGDWFANAVAMDGDLVVAAAYNTDKAYVFERNRNGTNTWDQAKKLIPTATLGVSDRYGISVAVDGDTVAIGRDYADIVFTNRGAVHVFERQAGAGGWNETVMLTASDGTTGDYFGTSVAICGDVMVVGAFSAGTRGAAYVFERRATGTNTAWVETTKLAPTSGTYIGWSVAVDGDVIAVGAPYSSGTGGGLNNAGAVFVFERDAEGNGAWGQVAKLEASDAAANRFFGYAVDVEGDVIVAGAPGDPTTVTTNFGYAYAFVRTRDGTNAWQEMARMTPSAPERGQRFANAVSVSGDLIAVGASTSNRVYLYHRDAGGDDAWGEVQCLQAPPGISILDRYGEDVELSDGALVVGTFAAGSAYLYPVVNQEWTASGGRLPSVRADEDWFGFSVDMDGAVQVVGAPYRDVGGTNDAGAVYVYERGTVGQIVRLEASSINEDDWFGFSVAVDGDVIVAGAPFFDTVSGVNAGATFVYHRNHVGTNAWGRITGASPLIPSTTITNFENFGLAVDVSGDTIIIGRPGRSGNTGQVEFFNRNRDGTNTWKHAAFYLGSAQYANRYFGSSVALDGDTALIGAPGDNFTNGVVYIARRTSAATNMWLEVKRFQSPEPQLNDAFGRNVALSGDTALVSAYSLGKAYLFERNRGGTNAWGLAATLIPTSTAEVAFAGINAVSLCGDVAVLGDPFATVDGTNGAGAAWVFARNAGGSNVWGQVAVLRRDEPGALDQFGYDVAVSGDGVFVGVPRDDGASTTNAGRALLFSGHPFAPPRIESIVKTGTVAEVSFPAQPAWRYDVEGSLDLLSGLWISLPGLTDLPGPTDGTLTISHTNVFGMTLYRVTREEP